MKCDCQGALEYLTETDIIYGLNETYKTQYHECAKCGDLFEEEVYLSARTLGAQSRFIRPYEGGLTKDELVENAKSCKGRITFSDEIEITRRRAR